jgi:maleate isomerase
MAPRRIGLIVPSSNTTIETEIPAMLAAADVTFHSSRAVLRSVDGASLDRMVADSDRCARELADARVDVLVYACLVALMARGAGAHEGLERRLEEVARERGCEAQVVSSAGALVRTLGGLGARRIAIVTPYVPELTALVADYLEAYDLEVVDSLSLGVRDNVAVGRLDPVDLHTHVARLDLGRADALVASACVQMPSLPAIAELEATLGLPVVSAATATAAETLDRLGLPRRVTGAGRLLSQEAPSAAR